MDFDSFLGAVQDRAQLSSTGKAIQVTRITLTALAERVQSGEADDLAAQLPDEIGRFLRAVDTTDSFSVDEFVDRLVTRGDYQPEERADAVFHAQVVLDVVSEAATAGEMQDIRDQLPDDWQKLFEVADQDASVSPSDRE